MNNSNSPFRKYRDVYLQMESDPRVQSLRDTIGKLQEKLEDAESVYKAQLSELEDGIKSLVLDAEESQEEHGVKATYTERKNTSWKSVALEFNPPDELVDKHTKVGRYVRVVTEGKMGKVAWAIILFIHAFALGVVVSELVSGNFNGWTFFLLILFTAMSTLSVIRIEESK